MTMQELLDWLNTPSHSVNPDVKPLCGDEDVHAIYLGILADRLKQRGIS